MDIQRVRELNDALRKTLQGGKVVMAQSVAALPPHHVAQALQTMQMFNAFTADNDPHGEHDCAIFTVGDQRFMFKIDYYDRNMELGSENPTDADQTVRVLTLMLASDY